MLLYIFFGVLFLYMCHALLVTEYGSASSKRSKKKHHKEHHGHSRNRSHQKKHDKSKSKSTSKPSDSKKEPTPSALDS
ncbi:hypothetical protein AAVH_34987 [Aphelenchoides avenae]|nr:hypothetical protein AAVH_34987 [Aphelenchus avenae]